MGEAAGRGAQWEAWRGAEIGDGGEGEGERGGGVV